MFLERQLRQWPVGRRVVIMLGALSLPMLALSVASVAVVNQQEMTFRESVEESVHTLMPLTTLERYLQQALVDELMAETSESVPDFAALTENIDDSFASVDASGHSRDLPEDMVAAAQKQWLDARPSVRELVERVHRLHAAGDAAAQARVQQDLQAAIRDVGAARKHLSRAVEARYVNAMARRHAQLMWLIGCWIAVLSISGLLVIILLRSILRPIRELGQATHSLGPGAGSVQVPVVGNDELAVLATRFNEMAAHWAMTHTALVAEATRDALTGVLNRRGILGELETALAGYALTQRAFSVFMVDLDGFKQVNDRLGHAMGDQVLVGVTEAMRRVLRAGDRLGRYGGDEFLVVLTDTDTAQAGVVAQRMTETVRLAATSDATLPTISIGVASAPENGTSADALITAADAALYRVKRDRQAQSAGPADFAEQPR